MRLHQATVLLLLVLGALGATAAARAQSDGIRVSNYQVTLQRDDEHLVVREAYRFENPGDTEIVPGGGGLRFDLPYDIHGEIQATIISSGQRSSGSLVPDATDPSVHGLEIALAPGRTTVTLSYSFHYTAETAFQPRFFYPMDQGELYVQPADMHVHGSAAREEQSPMPGFAAWRLDPLAQPGQLDITLSGGTTGGEQAQQAPSMQRPSPQEEWRVMIRPNRFAEGQLPVLVGLFLVTVLGLGLLYGINSGRGESQAKAARMKLMMELDRLEDRFVSGQIGREEFLQQRERMLKSTGGQRAKGSRKRQPVG